MADALKKAVHDRYHYASGKLDVARIGADSLSIGRVPAVEWYRYRLGHDMKSPEKRGWGLALQVAFLLFTDKIDGSLSTISQNKRGKTGEKDTLGGWIDQLSDKRVVNRLMEQLASNGEISSQHLEITQARDRLVTVGRIAMEGLNKLNIMDLETNAAMTGKLKTGFQSLGIVVACSPLHAKHPDLADNIFTVATTLSVISGSEYLETLPDQITSMVSMIANQDEAGLYDSLESFFASHKEQMASEGLLSMD